MSSPLHYHCIVVGCPSISCTISRNACDPKFHEVFRSRTARWKRKARVEQTRKDQQTNQRAGGRRKQRHSSQQGVYQQSNHRISSRPMVHHYYMHMHHHDQAPEPQKSTTHARWWASSATDRVLSGTLPLAASWPATRWLPALVLRTRSSLQALGHMPWVMRMYQLGVRR